MKRLIKDESKCIACGKCEEICSEAFFKEVNKEKSCIKISKHEDGTNKIIICTQCGDCSRVCNIAIIAADKNGVYRMNKKDCVGCLMCVGFCKEEAMMQNDDMIEPFKCVACGLCVKGCPTGAIQMQG